MPYVVFSAVSACFAESTLQQNCSTKVLSTWETYETNYTVLVSEIRTA